MKPTFLTLVLLLSGATVFAQKETKDDTPKDGWTHATNITLLFNQSAFNSAWVGGGTTNVAGNLSASYDFDYRKENIIWDNKILGDYGLTKLKDQECPRKTNDRFEFNSILGKQIKASLWYYSFFLNFITQFAPGYEFGEDTNGNTTRTETTHIFSPGYIQMGSGLLWKKSNNLKVHIAPATARLIVVDSKFTETDTDQAAIDSFNDDGGYFGVKANETTRVEFGSSSSATAKFNLMDNVSWENILKIYANYIEDLTNIDIDYTANIEMTINKYLSANLTFQAIYDDNAVGAFQIREVFGLGVNYGL